MGKKEETYTIPTIDDVLQAAKNISGLVHRTPILTSHSINRILNGDYYFKCENFQRAGAFKYRGASNAIAHLKATDGSKLKAVATHSSGNHAGALALAAKQQGIACHVVMPKNSPAIKIAAVREYGAKISFCEPSLAARESGLEKVLNQTSATFIHPYNNFFIIAGQGTATLEILDNIEDLNCLIAPVGGGGLLSGSAIAAKAIFPGIKVYGAEPEGANDAWRSMRAGKIIPSVNPVTIADGLLTSLGTLTFKAINENVDDILTVSEKGIVQAMRLIWERMKIIVEPSGCVPLAAIMEHPELFQGKKTAVILSGGNIDVETAYGIFTNSTLTG